jgi:putative hydrolase of the HAD superfamily
MGTRPLPEWLAARWRVIVFDLDDTLYPEWAYLEAAYDEISRVVEERWDLPARKVRDRLHTEFQSGGRRFLFDRVLHNLDLQPEVLPIMLEVLRSATPSGGLELYPWAKTCLDYLRAHDLEMYLLTNGNPRQQANKVRLLNHAGALDDVQPVYAQDLVSKPDPAGLLYVSRAAGCHLTQMLFVGDSVIDALTAENAGVTFMAADEVREIFEPD